MCGSFKELTLFAKSEILDVTITDTMGLIIIQLLNYDLSSEIKEEVQGSYFQDNVPEHVLANVNK